MTSTEQVRAWRKANPERYRLHNRKSMWKRLGIDYKEAEERLNSAKNCDICGIKDVKFCVDHCHSDKGIRGVLCLKCNFAIGLLDNKPELLRKSIEYLNDYSTRNKRDQERSGNFGDSGVTS